MAGQAMFEKAGRFSGRFKGTGSLGRKGLCPQRV